MKRFGALPLLLIAFALVACGPDLSVGPDDGGYGGGSGGGGYGGGGSSRSFYNRFYYYYGEACRYDAFGQSYDCSDHPYVLSPSVSVDVRITYDGFATFCVNDECSYYDPDEYFEGYDRGDRYYEFPGDDERYIVYTDGSEFIYIDTYEGFADYYYYDRPTDYYY